MYAKEMTGVYYNTCAIIDADGRLLGKCRKNHIPHLPDFWELDQPALAVANGYFIATINRVGIEAPWNTGRFYGSSYICNPKVEIIAKGSENKDETIIADVDLDMI